MIDLSFKALELVNDELSEFEIASYIDPSSVVDFIECHQVFAFVDMAISSFQIVVRLVRLFIEFHS